MLFKRIGLAVVGVALLFMSAGIVGAEAPVWTFGFIPHDEDLAGVRYRSFANTGGREIFLGVPDLGLAANRQEIDITWEEWNDVTFVFNRADDKLTTEVVNGAGTFTLEYPNLSSQIASLGKKFTLVDLNIMQITIANRDEDTTVNFDDVFLDGMSLGSFGGNGFFDWMVKDDDFSQGFTITGTLHLLGTFSTSQELSKLEIKVGHITPNQPPDCSKAYPSTRKLWPPDHRFVKVKILGVIDPDDDPITIKIDSIFQDEPVDSTGDGNTAPDGKGVGGPAAWVRAERQNLGNGRVYHIYFTADDAKGGTCSGEVRVGVPKSLGNKHRIPVDDGPLYDSTVQ